MRTQKRPSTSHSFDTHTNQLTNLPQHQSNQITTQLVPLVRWIPASWTANILYLAYLPIHLRFQVR
jgi:hypothetical protein